MSDMSMDDGWTCQGKAIIAKTVEVFSSWTSYPEGNDWEWIRVPGSVFSKDMYKWSFYVMKYKNGFDIQCCGIGYDGSESPYLFGVRMNGNDDIVVYHNGHGPFPKYGLEL
jgi:hypothetical protein